MDQPAPGTIALQVARLETPIGPLHVYARAGVLVAVEFGPPGPRSGLARRFPSAAIVTAPRTAPFAAPLARYFDGELGALDGVAVEPGGTAFQARVWRELRRIPVGRTLSYGELARRLGDPHATRAVGLANGQNPIAIVIPCHRVIGADGTLTGYGGGLDRKEWLLRHERALGAQQRPLFA